MIVSPSLSGRFPVPPSRGVPSGIPSFWSHLPSWPVSLLFAAIPPRSTPAGTCTLPSRPYPPIVGFPVALSAAWRRRSGGDADEAAEWRHCGGGGGPR
ncbi:hypothetical protein HMPREF0294_1344 [Corynebacterium glucuronolyticum ATCC 51867]|uniref:Uncharacterized protein n=1 Tax=Corynebacterium glucuronolyticum ATCC 51866 TaxID=548478 RepID=A0ABM9XMJ6_9CORY|nr:hypothetical protein HMPREF0294_1344 [Corynebacterium glucuronolyticum ATCC 51867]EEI62374.1 hypothetical protein HMPREF0293_2095 [Corynebacterium glucuronolyticum ATCC 51866]